MKTYRFLTAVAAFFTITGLAGLQFSTQAKGEGFLLNPTAEGKYTLVEIGTNVVPTAISNLGQVVGRINASYSRAFLWSEATGMHDIGMLEGDMMSGAYGINDTGQVVGESFPAGYTQPPYSGMPRAFLWTQSGGMVDIGSLSGHGAAAHAINNLGAVCGTSNSAMPGILVPFIWTSNNGMQSIGTLGGNGYYNVARHINNLNQVVGGSSVATGIYSHAYLWSELQGMQDLGMLPGDSGSEAECINDSGQVVGCSDGGKPAKAFVWSSATGMAELPSLGLGGDTGAYGINNAGVIVGHSGENAVIWQNDHSTDLNQLLVVDVNYRLTRARSINDAGQIVAEGSPTTSVTASAGPNGSIFPGGIIKVDVGFDQQFTTTSDPNYMVDQWYLDGNSVQRGNIAYTLYNIRSPHTIYVTFRTIPPAIYVDANSPNDPGFGTPQDPFRHIQDAADAVQEQGTIIIRPGTYRESVDSAAKSLVLTSLDPNDPNTVKNTIIDANGFQVAIESRGTSDPPYIYPTVTIAGFTIENPTTYQYTVGDAIYGEYATVNILKSQIGHGGVVSGTRANVIVSDSLLNSVYTGYSGGDIDANNCRIGGLFIGENSYGNIRNSTLQSVSLNESAIDMDNCSIDGSASDGLNCESCYSEGPGISINIKDCSITNCKGAGIFLSTSDYVIVNTIISGNKGGGIVQEGFSGGVIRNCMITDNTGYRGREHDFDDSLGGGLFVDNSSVSIQNCTIANNKADHGAGVYAMWDSVVSIENCIISANVGEQLEIAEEVYSEVLVRFSDVQNGWPSIGNIDADPLFVDPNNPDPNARDYHLKSEAWRWAADANQWTWDDVTSRCIDAGSPGSPLGDEPTTLPVDPLNRFGVNKRIDMGAYGGTKEASMPPHGWQILSNFTNDGRIDFVDYALFLEDYPSWQNPNDPPSTDFNRDGTVNWADFCILVSDWLEEAAWL
jgi:probable HAF family extracellular repeat protein